jgi:hypothetical protein
MTSMKQCRRCGKVKDTTQFSKSKANSDGLQRDCKECNKITNHKFRTEINPEHHRQWQWDNVVKYNQYIKKYRKADKNGIIYAITNAEGEVYIGMSEAYLNVRMIEHRKHYRQYKQGKRNSLPGLHKSIDKFGWKNHNIQTLLELQGIDRKELENIERSFIELVKQTGKSLNKRNW